MKSMSDAERGSTGTAVTSAFHQLLVGKTWRPASGSVNTGGAAARTMTTVPAIASETANVRRATAASRITYHAGAMVEAKLLKTLRMRNG
jgi:hypothetical protein